MSTATDKDIKTATTIRQSYGDANTYYKNIIDNLKYKEIVSYNDSTPPTLVDVGCICNLENSSFSFNADRYWDKDTTTMSIQNARKLINDLEWQEQSNMHNGTIQSKPGMVVLTKGADSYSSENPNASYFDDIAANATGPTADFNTYNIATGGRGTAIDLFGYFHPDATGSWTFSIPASNPGSGLYTYLWVGDTSLHDYTIDNANIKSTTPTQTNQVVTASFAMNKDDYIPFRIQIISINAKFNNANNPPIFTVTPPSNSKANGVITGNTDKGWTYFVTFLKDGAIYYKNLLYFGLVQSNQDTSKFDCYFVSTSPENKKYIRQYKQTQKLQFVKVEIPTPTMKGTGTVNATDGARFSLGERFIKGVKVTINRATYGMPDPTYYYTTYSTKYVEKQENIPASTKTEVLPSSDPNLPTKTTSTTTQAHTETVTVPTIVPNPPTPVSQQIDVTAKVQQLVDSRGEGYKLIIEAGANNFYNLFGNPVADPVNDPNGALNVAKTLYVEYTYEVPDSIIDDKFIFVNPKNGLLSAGAIFNNNNVTIPMSMDSSASACSEDKCKSYSMKITDKCELIVNNENGQEVGRIDLKKYTGNRFDLNNCQVNKLWLKDAYMQSSVNAGQTTSTIQGRKFKSADSRFKLEYENKKLYLTYCIIPYSQLSNGLRYTTTFNISNMNNSQIYYLYRINTRGLFGRKFLQETDKSTGDTIMHYIPNSHEFILSQPLDPTQFFKITNAPAFPLFKDGSPAFAANYNANTTGATTYTACANQCTAEPNNKCEHFFFVSNNDGTTRCYTDKVADSNPAFSLNKTHSNTQTSDLYKKPYNIKSTCASMPDMQPLQYTSSLSASAIDYRIPENAPNMTYYCSLDRFKQDNQTVWDNYGTVDAMTNMTVREGMTPQYNRVAHDVNTDVLNRIPIITGITQKYSENQDKIGQQYDETINKLSRYENLYQAVSSPQYNYNGTDSLIPDKFQNNQNPKPNISYIDGAKKDVGVMLMQQNTMYTLASITAATCLILGVMFTGGGSE